MGVQQQLLEKLGQSLVVQFRKSIEPVKATGRTAESIHAVANDTEVEVLAARNIWAIEDGRKPTGAGAKKGNPTLFEAIKEWAQVRGIITDVNDRKQMGIVYAITQKIHKEGTALYRGVDHYGRTAPSGLLTSVIKSINEESLLRELVEYQVSVYSDKVINKAKELA